MTSKKIRYYKGIYLTNKTKWKFGLREWVWGNFSRQNVIWERTVFPCIPLLSSTFTLRHSSCCIWYLPSLSGSAHSDRRLQHVSAARGLCRVKMHTLHILRNIIHELKTKDRTWISDRINVAEKETNTFLHNLKEKKLLVLRNVLHESAN